MLGQCKVMVEYLNDFVAICTRLGIAFKVLDVDSSEILRERIRSRFPSVRLGSPIDFYSETGLQAEQPWKLLAELLDKIPVYFLFPWDREKRALWIEIGGRLSEVLDESEYFVEYIITDENQRFLLGEHHSGILMACGAAEQWVSQLARRRGS